MCDIFIIDILIYLSFNITLFNYLSILAIISILSHIFIILAYTSIFYDSCIFSCYFVLYHVFVFSHVLIFSHTCVFIVHVFMFFLHILILWKLCVTLTELGEKEINHEIFMMWFMHINLCSNHRPVYLGLWWWKLGQEIQIDISFSHDPVSHPPFFPDLDVNIIEKWDICFGFDELAQSYLLVFWLLTSCARYWDLVLVQFKAFELYLVQSVTSDIFPSSVSSGLPQGFEEIVHVAYLTWLANSIVMWVESFLIVEFDSLIHIFEELDVEEETYNSCSCSPFPMVAMETHNSIYLFVCHRVQKVESIPADSHECEQGGSLVIFPRVLFHLVLQQTVFVGSIAHVYDQVVVVVFSLQILGNIINGIPVSCLQPWCRESHCYDRVCDVS